LGMTHLSDDEDRRLNSPRPCFVIDELFEGSRHCRTGSNRRSSSRTRSKHSTPLHRAPFLLSNPKSHLESVVKAQAMPPPPPPPPSIEEPESTELPPSKSLTQVLADWKKFSFALIPVILVSDSFREERSNARHPLMTHPNPPPTELPIIPSPLE